MPSRSESTTHQTLTFYNAFNKPNQLIVWRRQETGAWDNSPRDSSGKLILRSNTCNLREAVLTHYTHNGRILSNGLPSRIGTYQGAVFKAGTAHPFGGHGGWRPASLTNRAYSRFWGRVRKDSASLGVSLAGYAQSRDMMLSRAKQFGKLLLDQIRSYKASHRRLKRARKALERNRKTNPMYEDRASDYLEHKFGWAPLIEDFIAASRLFWTPPPSRFFSATAEERTSWSGTSVPSSGRTKTEAWLVHARCTYAAKVTVSNDHLWMANKAGFINLPGIAWDLVPWSFVINMFANVNQMLSHPTQDIGLTVSDASVTFTHREYCEVVDRYNDGNGLVRENVLYRTKSRSLTNLTPRWALKAPELDASLVVTASALVLQRARRLQKLFG